MIVTFALKKPVAIGEKVTVIVQLAPGASGELDMQLSLSVNGAGMESELITSAAPPVFVNVANSGEEFPPRATVPKLVIPAEIVP